MLTQVGRLLDCTMIFFDMAMIWVMHDLIYFSTVHKLIIYNHSIKKTGIALKNRYTAGIKKMLGFYSCSTKKGEKIF